MFLRRFASAVLPVLLLAGCGESPAEPEPLERLPRELSAAEREVVAANTRFAWNLLREVNRTQRDENVFLSPLNASLALGMTMNGARGATLDAMRETLGFHDTPLPEINRSYRDLVKLLRSLDSGIDLRIGNSIWYRDDFPVVPAFFDTTRTYFDAEVRGLDFADPRAPATINAWVERSTAGKIKEIVERIEANEVMYLINAVYFKGDWTQPFPKDATYDAPFTTPGGTPVTVKMMHRREAKLRHTQTAEYEAAELAYGRGAFAMTIVLPAPGEDINELIQALDDAAWAELTNGMAERELDVFLPRFRLEYERNLNNALDALGMGIAFGPGQDFTGMSPSNPWIDEVFQKTYVDVNEQGTEAAAVTKVVMVESLPPSFVVDRPFLFAIRERFSGALLFVGKIVFPPAA